MNKKVGEVLSITHGRLDILDFVMKDEIIYNSLNENEAAVYIGMSRSFLAISRMEGSGEKRTPGPAFVKVGRRVIYLKADLDAWLAQEPDS